MINDKEILQAVRQTRDEWESTLATREIEALNRWLDEAERDHPAATHRVLEIVQQHPQAHARVRQELGIKGLEAFRLYEPSAGGPEEVPAGTWMVCPENPEHCRKRLRQKGQVLICAEHGVPLVPADSVPPKE
jgi:hypothetical protein